MTPEGRAESARKAAEPAGTALTRRVDESTFLWHFMPMKGSSEVFGDLAAFLTHIYTILDAAVELSLQDFQRRYRPFEAHHFASGVRHEAKCRLEELAAIFPCTVNDLPNNGLFVLHEGYAIRIRKADDGGLPSTNGSETLTAFYEQMPLPFIAIEDGQPSQSATELNLIIIWDTDAHHHLAWVEVVCPLGEDEILWRRPVPHPATVTVAPPAAAEPTEDDFDFEQTDEDDESDESIN